jgi:N-acetylmuramoyl-L-alanine amidase
VWGLTRGDTDRSSAVLRAERRAEERRARHAFLRRQRRAAIGAASALALGASALAFALESGGNGRASTPSHKPGTRPVRVGTTSGTQPKRSIVPASRRETGTTTRASANAEAGYRHSAVAKPHIVWRRIPFGPKRHAETVAYALRHYGLDRWQLIHPSVIVEHYTASSTFASTYNYFAGDTPDVELGELPGVCAHFVIDTDGTIYQLVPLNTMCRHTVGLNWTAIGIEHVGLSDQQILDDHAQLSASLALTVWLMGKYHIQLQNVIGHNESLTSPYHHELYKAWRCQTHADWNHADMQIYRADLRLLARRYGVPIGPAARPIAPTC